MAELRIARALQGFPAAQIAVDGAAAPIEVHLISQLGHGQGDALIVGAGQRQRRHHSFVDALDEPSARIGGLQPERGDRSSLYTFSVGRGGHPFHRHAGPRVFTAVAGSSGALLRFSTSMARAPAGDPEAFLASLQQVIVPPDSLFTVRFGGGVWHQFMPLDGGSGHPALFALSCHTDEVAGIDDPALLAQVLANEATIPGLTEVLPEALAQRLRERPADAIPTIRLSLEPIDSRVLAQACQWVRGGLGRLRATLARIRDARGFASTERHVPEARFLPEIPADALLAPELGGSHGHDDTFWIELPASEAGSREASALLASLLDGFLHDRPAGVSLLMRLRNALVMPLGLRRSPLGCPVSSLLTECPSERFVGVFPVLGQRVSADGRRVEVLLGADDRHLRFRSVVGVERHPDGRVHVMLGSRVAPRNAFGRLYMALITTVHRRYIGPTLLRRALAHALAPAIVSDVPSSWRWATGRMR